MSEIIYCNKCYHNIDDDINIHNDRWWEELELNKE